MRKALGVLVIGLCCIQTAAWGRRKSESFPFFFHHQSHGDYVCVPVPEPSPDPSPEPTPTPTASPTPTPGPTVCVINVISSGDEGDFYDVTIDGQGGTMQCSPGTNVPANYCGPLPSGCMIIMSN